MSLLATIKSPADLKRLGRDQLPELAQEIRDRLIECCSITGGHIGASLAGLNLDTYQAAMKGGSTSAGGVVNGPVIKPGNAAASYLYQAVAGKQTVGAPMPLGRAPLPQKDIQTIYNWIQSGAKK